MPGWIWAVIAFAIVVVAFGVAMAVMQRRRTRRLRGRFGAEYDRMLQSSNGRRDAEGKLEEREARRAKLAIRPLPPAARERYARQWEQAQARFVDDPPGAISEADLLVQAVMGDKGYPVGDDFESRAAEVSSDHPDVVEHYRAAHRVAGAGSSSTEDERQAMQHFRALFDELLGGDRAAGERGAVAAGGGHRNN